MLHVLPWSHRHRYAIQHAGCCGPLQRCTAPAMPFLEAFLDVEAGQPIPEAENVRTAAPTVYPTRLRHRARTSQGFVIGIVILLFLAGLVPFSSVLFLLLALCALSSYIQYNANALVRQEPEQQSTNTTGLPAQLSSERAERTRQWHMANMMMMGTVGGLSMMNRDFNESDYEMLLQLDQPRQGERNQQPAATEEQLASIPSFTLHKKQDTTVDAMEKDQNVCSICLDPFAEGDQLSLLPCTHKFHTTCIQPWAQCPLCKLPVFDNR